MKGTIDGAHWKQQFAQNYSQHKQTKPVGVGQCRRAESLKTPRMSTRNSQGPDEIIDIEERYGSSEEEVHEERYDSSEEEQVDEERGDDEEKAQEFRQETPRQPQSGYGMTFSSLFEKMNFNEVLNNIQKASTEERRRTMTPFCHSFDCREPIDAATDAAVDEEKQNLMREVTILKAEHSREIGQRDDEISHLQIRLAHQKKTFACRSDAQAKLVGKLKERARVPGTAVEPVVSKSEVDCETLRTKVEFLQSELQELSSRNETLEASLDARHKSHDIYIGNATTRISELEQKYDATTKSLAAEKVQSRKLELTLAKAEAMLTLETKKMKTMELSEKRTRLMLETEKKKVEALERLNARLKQNKKHETTYGREAQLQQMKQELREKDRTILSIRRIMATDAVQATMQSTVPAAKFSLAGPSFSPPKQVLS